MDFRTLINEPQYAFLHEHPRLGERILLLGVSGSYGYGTNREGSDVDLRGVTLNMPSDLIGLSSYEQFEDRGTDTVIYSFMKFIRLLLDCNPNIIEILGLEPGQYVMKNRLGDRLLENRHIFLSQRAADSFGHYADAQLRRLQNAAARDRMKQEEREKHIYKSVTNALASFNREHESWEKGSVRLYIDQAETEGLDEEIFLDADLSHYPLRRYNEMMNTMTSVVREYAHAGNRNQKKDEEHLNKHAMHLVRLFMTGIDILEKEEIITRRSGDDLVLLKKIRNGDYMENGLFIPEFYEIVTEYEARFEKAKKNTHLPEKPDMERIESLTEEINRHVVMEDL